MKKRIWYCKIGIALDDDLPDGADLPMRFAVERAFLELTGRKTRFCFSGWGTIDDLTSGERGFVEENGEVEPCRRAQRKP